MDLPVPTNQQPIPKKSCMINLMFEIDDCLLPMKLYEQISELIKDIPNKRFSVNLEER